MQNASKLTIRQVMIGRRQLFFTLCLLVLFSVTQSSKGQTDDDVVRIDTNLIQLNIGVVDRRGHPMLDLQRDNFIVYEDGERQSITSFESITTKDL